MNKLSLVLILLMSVSFAFAKKPTKRTKAKTVTTASKSKFDIRKPIKKYFNKYKKGIRAGVATGSLDTNVRFRRQGLNRSDNRLESTNFQVHLGYEEVKTKELGFSSYLTYQDIRDVKGLGDHNVRNMRISGNATYGLTDQAYTYGGLNYSKYYANGDIEDGLNAGIGYQAGLGLKLHKRIQLEVEYLTLLNEGRKDGINIDAAARGLMIRLNTPLFL